MTDPKPDPLFDALREQLADYGQEPPAHLWAGIRQQLPPPAALPQRRRRRILSVALLAMLLAVIGVVGWQAWELSPLRQPAVTSRPAGQASESVTTGSRPSQPATASVAAPSGAATQTAAATVATADAVAAATTSTMQPALSNPTTATSAAGSVVAATPGNATGAAPSAAGTQPAGPAAASPLAPPATVAAPAGVLAASAPHHPGSVARPGPQSKTRGAALVAATTYGSGRSRTVRHGAAATTVASAATPAARHFSASSPSSVARVIAIAPAPTAAANPSASAENQANPAAGTTAAVAALPATPYDALALREPTLTLPPLPAPADPPRPPVQRSAPPRLPAVRWVAYTLAGPALTGIRQGTAPTLAYNAPTTYVPMVQEQEYATSSGSLQVGLRRNLGAHWSLSAGLSITDYATQSTLSRREIASVGNSLDPLGQRDQLVEVTQYRKSHRFVSLPVRLGYGWQPTGRWQLGVLAGAEATYLYQSDEVKSVALQTGTRVSTVAANQRWGLGGSLGLEARYHLGARCELLAQPTFTYLLTPLNSPRDGVTPRHPWSAALLLGVAYEIR